MNELETLAYRFRRFAELECRDSSPLYERLSTCVAGDAELLEMATHCSEGQPAPNLFFGAAHLVLLENPGHPLSAYYASVVESPKGAGGRLSPLQSIVPRAQRADSRDGFDPAGADQRGRPLRGAAAGVRHRGGAVGESRGGVHRGGGERGAEPVVGPLSLRVRRRRSLGRPVLAGAARLRTDRRAAAAHPGRAAERRPPCGHRPGPCGPGRCRVGGVAARVDLAGAPAARGGARGRASPGGERPARAGGGGRAGRAARRARDGAARRGDVRVPHPHAQPVPAGRPPQIRRDSGRVRGATAICTSCPSSGRARRRSASGPCSS